MWPLASVGRAAVGDLSAERLDGGRAGLKQSLDEINVVKKQIETLGIVAGRVLTACITRSRSSESP